MTVHIAMTEARSFKWSRFAVLSLIASTAVLAVIGSVSQFLPLPEEAGVAIEWVLVLAFGALCGFSLWVANASAACAQILADHRERKPWAFGIAIVTAGLTGLVSVIGVDLGWLTLTGQQQELPDSKVMIGVGFALAFVKVAMGFVIEACETIERDRAKAEEIRQEERHDRRTIKLANVHAKAERPKPVASARPVKKRPSVVQQASVAAASVLALAGAASTPAHATPERAPTTTTNERAPAPAKKAAAKPAAAKPKPVAKAAPIDDAKRAAARARVDAGESPTRVAEDTGIPAGTCRRWASERKSG